MDQYSRTIRLIGEEKQTLLHQKSVLLFGLGGVGGGCLEGLARAGIGKLTLVDNDAFALSNLNRQILATHETIGKNKVDVAEERVKAIDPNIQVMKKKMFYLPEKKAELPFEDYDLVIDCIDTISAKLDIITEAKKQNIPVLSAMGCGNRLDPTQLRIGELFLTSGDPLAKVMRRELRKRGVTSLTVVYSLEHPTKPAPLAEEEAKEASPKKGRKDVPGSAPFVPLVAGELLAYEAVKILLGEEEKEKA
jgi:tRNA A37 threonylcarbamoyladenosine dehydratase